METFKERNYKKEYENYHSKPEQKKRRAGRNKARRDVVKSVKDSKQLIDKGWNPDFLYTFIYVSEGGAGLRLNTIQINYLKSLAGFIG